MSNVPLARELVAEAVQMLPADSPARAKLQAAMGLMTREPPVKVARKKSRMMTLGVAVEIWRFYRRHPRSPHQEIADAMRVNPGRVSEVLTRARYPEAEKLSKENP